MAETALHETERTRPSGHPPSVRLIDPPLPASDDELPCALTSRLISVLLHLATHDQLTGLLNRAAAFGRLSAALAAARPGARVGLCYLDLDGFKAVNDRQGHGAGDELLAALAERIGRVARAHGAVAARIGGDEFVVLAETSPGLPGMISLAADLLDQARRPVALTPAPVCVSACVGIVDRPAAGATVERLVADADTALYEAKSIGRGGQWSVYASPRQRAS